MFEKDRLHECLRRIGIREPGPIFDQLSAAYGSDDRHYHDQSHVSECLTHFDQHRALASQPDEIEIAIWFHDAIYDSTKPDNEERSAVWAEEFLSEHSVQPDSVSRISELIHATKTHRSTSEDCALMLDIDLGILGTREEVFERYDQAIRLEYHWVPEEQYFAGRVGVLESFLERPQIYGTDYFFANYEQQARMNLKRKIEELSV